MSNLNLIDERKAIVDSFMAKPDTAEELQQWVLTYLDIWLPLGHVDPDSNSSPAEWVFHAYNTYRHNQGDLTPGYIILSSRDSYKTLSESILAVMLMAHFGATIAHLAAIETQARKAVSYVTSFVKKIQPMLQGAGKEVDAQNKRQVIIRDKDGNQAFVNIIIATIQGANCVSPDSIVYVDGQGERRVADVVPGERVRTYDYLENRHVMVRVGGVSKTVKPSLKVKTDDGDELVLSTDHLVFTQHGWKRASCLRLGDRLTNLYRLPERTIHGNYKVEPERSAEQYLLGTLLGDASLSRPTKRHHNYIYQIARQARDALYVKIGADLLSRQMNLSTKIYKVAKGRMIYGRTNSCEYLTKLREELYVSGRKRVTEAWLDRLTAEGVAYWLMDDGSGCPEKIGATKDRALSLATCGFSMAENHMIVKWFIQKGFQCKVDSISNQTGKRYPCVKFTLDASRKLTQWVRPYLLPSLAYKFPAPSAELFRRTVDCDEEVLPGNVRSGFCWTHADASKRGYRTQQEFREWNHKIKACLATKVVKIEHMGLQELVDLHIDTDKPTLRSFTINDGKLVHNSEHTNVLSVDEVDVMRFPKAYEEAKFIPGYDGATGQHPITIKTSTRKFAFGLMEKEIQNAKQAGDLLLRWNILDVTEKCPESRHRPNEPKQDRYIHPKLPLRNLSRDEFNSLSNAQKDGYKQIKAYSGCADCKLLPVCQMRLAHRPEGDKGGLYKPISFTIGQFKKFDPDMGEAQLMCWKPSQSGLIYGRYEDAYDTGNLKSIFRAWEQFTGTPAPKELTLRQLTDFMLLKGVQFEAGGDWGFRHAFAIVVSAKVMGEWWLIDSLSVSGLDPDQQVAAALELKDRYKIRRKWYMDTSQPGMMSLFKKKGMPCKSFTKDVQLGIALTKTQIIDASGRRRLFIIDHEGNSWLRQGFCKHHYRLDSEGEPTTEPDDDEYADIMDTIRYKAQNMFHKSAQAIMGTESSNLPANMPKPFPNQGMSQDLVNQPQYESWLMQQARQLATADDSTAQGTNKDKTIFWSFGNGDGT